MGGVGASRSSMVRQGKWRQRAAARWQERIAWRDEWVFARRQLRVEEALRARPWPVVLWYSLVSFMSMSPTPARTKNWSSLRLVSRRHFRDAFKYFGMWVKRWSPVARGVSMLQGDPLLVDRRTLVCVTLPTQVVMERRLRVAELEFYQRVAAWNSGYRVPMSAVRYSVFVVLEAYRPTPLCWHCRDPVRRFAKSSLRGERPMLRSASSSWPPTAVVCQSCGVGYIWSRTHGLSREIGVDPSSRYYHGAYHYAAYHDSGYRGDW